ncbi:glycoside hydrolase domain-containing protein [Lactococcus protaetiae]|uniref:DUF1906 domain-containing protein n=1 Tax=Lactococcus protaetiae TaxID=2592653 RepID=A0A514Z5L2_9LACT|nr:glycoside hydrolase domain-containing protein [Lactococcus protaetiae]QDK69882.1 DUF1906 domain-containing protein [Lactococcus protaetiae]
MWAKALFDMSAFVLVPGGAETIREMQQWLNVNYNEYFGIMPCDGIYQRDTNTALIYALQAEEGLGVGTANGAYGPTTTADTPTLSIGASGNFVEILQYALYVNGFYQSGPFDGNYTQAVADAVSAFQKFMVIPVTGTANVTTFKALLSSAGDTNRSATGADTATQLSSAQIQTLANFGVKYIGRYLTGTVGSANTPKNLTVSEATAITAAGISIFPIYEDGGYVLTYFTAAQGLTDGDAAGIAARNLGIPANTVIYFAVDVDIEDGDIDGTVIPYFASVQSELANYGYQVGVYGTRNVCARVSNAGYANFAFVADMSTGWSGNLGFAMPQNWAFDQFCEFTLGSGSGAVDIDQDAVSGRDTGFNTLVSDIPSDILQKIGQIGNLLPTLSDAAKITVSLDKEFKFSAPGYDIYSKLTLSTSVGEGDNVTTFDISDGAINATFTNTLFNLYDFTQLDSTKQAGTLFNELGNSIQNGSLNVGIATEHSDEEAGNIGIQMTYTFKADEVEDGPEVEYEWEVQVYYNKPVIAAKNADGYSSLAQVVANCAVTVAGSVKLAHIYAVMNETVPGTEWVDDDAEEVLPVLQNIAPFLSNLHSVQK